jgi:hypothetical protein
MRPCISSKHHIVAQSIHLDKTRLIAAAQNVDRPILGNERDVEADKNGPRG